MTFQLFSFVSIWIFKTTSFYDIRFCNYAFYKIYIMVNHRPHKVKNLFKIYFRRLFVIPTILSYMFILVPANNNLFFILFCVVLSSINLPCFQFFVIFVYSFFSLWSLCQLLALTDTGTFRILYMTICPCTVYLYPE